MKAGKKRKNEPGGESTPNKRLFTYSLAAGTALAMAQPAGAAIQCFSTGPNEGIVNSGTDPYCVDLNGDAVDDFCFFYTTGSSSSYFWRSIAMTAASANSMLFTSTTYASSQIARLQQGQPVGPTPEGNNFWSSGRGFLNGTYSYCPDSCTGPYPYGQFFDQQGCIGVKFWSYEDYQYHYGWIEYQGDDGPSGKIVGWGYETAPNTPIPACTCEETPVPTLNPFGFAILAGLVLAGGAVAVRRRRKSE